MEISVVLDLQPGGRNRARAGDPLNFAAEGATAQDATRVLGALLEAMLAARRQDTTTSVADDEVARPEFPLPADNLYQTDWVFRELQEAVAEGRRQDERSWS